MSLALALVESLILCVDAELNAHNNNDDEYESEAVAFGLGSVHLVDLTFSTSAAASTTPRWEWLNPPSTVLQLSSHKLVFLTDPERDFWQTPELDRDNGHLLFTSIDKNCNFTATVTLCGEYSVMYDQMGFMLRFNANANPIPANESQSKCKSNWKWIKCGIEFMDGTQHMSCVVTNVYSDWNICPLLQNPKSIQIKMSKDKNKIMVQYKLPNEKQWHLLRKIYVDWDFDATAATMQVGLMACSPQRTQNDNGFHAEFRKLCLQCAGPQNNGNGQSNHNNMENEELSIIDPFED